MLTLLRGGPQDGKVADTHGSTPAILNDAPRNPTLLDRPEREAAWSEKRGWYEVRPYEGLRQWIALARLGGEITARSAAARLSAVNKAERDGADPPDIRTWA